MPRLLPRNIISANWRRGPKVGESDESIFVVYFPVEISTQPGKEPGLGDLIKIERGLDDPSSDYF